jgi:hypothetical protein
MRIIRDAGGRGLALVIVLTLTGCGGVPDQPPLGTVTGVITLDGKPLEFVEVSFSPEVGRPSDGETNSLGEYELSYVQNTKGAKVGKHTIMVRSGKIDNSQLKPVEIKPGRNVINIECVAKLAKPGKSNSEPRGDDVE